jgi:hypothetical protein
MPASATSTGNSTTPDGNFRASLLKTDMTAVGWRDFGRMLCNLEIALLNHAEISIE